LRQASEGSRQRIALPVAPFHQMTVWTKLLRGAGLVPDNPELSARLLEVQTQAESQLSDH